jgi:ABC-type sugar transport system ATPase subunit
VELVEPLGDETLLHLRSGEAMLRLRHEGPARTRAGETTAIGFDPAHAHRFDAAGQRLH